MVRAQLVLLYKPLDARRLCAMTTRSTPMAIHPMVANKAVQCWTAVVVRSVRTILHAHIVQILHFTWSSRNFVPDTTKTVTPTAKMFLVIQTVWRGVTNCLAMRNANVGQNMEILCTTMWTLLVFATPPTAIVMMIMDIV